ncbi:MAG: pantetheine-phosphate adenylyltransferase [Flavobacteriales bacterium]|jgi:pantetheine-phosphate adenylyltransferase|nr:pantetheine-phosphate adenylyltransferase [Flavobacteriales bacterium]
MEKVAVFPGSFDPITKGHESIIKRASLLFDKIVVAIGVNSSKKYMFSLEQRIRFCEATFNESNISIDTYEGLTIDYCTNIGARYLLRGLRTSADFEYESGIAQMNKAMKSETDTIFMLTPPELSAISSTIVRDILKNGGDVSQFVPSGIKL